MSVLNIPHFLVHCVVVGEQTRRAFFKCARKTLSACNNIHCHQIQVLFSFIAQSKTYFITRRRSFAEYWKHFVARFNDVHASGYNSTESERIWMKFGVLRACSLELAMTDFGCDPRRSESGRAIGNFFFFVR